MPMDARTRELAELLEMSQRWLHDYPDLGQAAEIEAKRLLRLYPVPLTDVFKLYWHRFDNAHSSPRAFTGWAHSGPPVQSLSLPALVLQRFPLAAQDNLDQLDMFSGFYTTPADGGVFDETREVPLLPSQLSTDFWQADFAGHYRTRLAYFWRTRTADFIALSRASALTSIGQGRNQGRLSEQDLSVLRGALAPGIGRDLSANALSRYLPPRRDVHITGLSIAGHSARHVLRIHSARGGQYLYIPGAKQAFHRFESDDALATWLAEHTRTPEGLKQLQQHFAPSETGIRNALAELANDALGPGWLGGEALPLGSDPFAWLAERAQAEMEQHAHQALTSNSRLRKDEAIAFLSTLSGLALNLAPVGWPIALVAVTSAGLAMGLDIDKVVNARSTAERNQAIGAAVGAGLSALLTLPFLTSAEVPDWPWEVNDGEPTALPETSPVPSSPVSFWPLNAQGMIERTDMDFLFAVQPSVRGQFPTTLLEEGLPVTSRFGKVPPMLSGPVVRAFGNAEGALAHAKANFDGPFHFFRLHARGARVASLRYNLRLNRANTLALLGQEDSPLSGEALRALGDGAWLEHEVHVAATDLQPARLRLLSPMTVQPWRQPALNVLRGVQCQRLNSTVAPSFLIETKDSLRLVRFDPFSESWRTPQGTAFRYNGNRSLFESFDVTNAPEALAPTIEAATAELGMPATFPWRIPDLPTDDQLPLPRMIHSVWIGRRMPGKLADNLLRNVAQAGLGQTPFDYHLYLAVDDPLDHALTLADLAAAPPNLHIHELTQTPFFREFQSTRYYQQYVAATQGSGINYASATDVLRYRLVDHFGGLYMDVDDVIYASTPGQSLADQQWSVAPGRLLLNGLVSEPRLGLHCGFNTSNFASLPNNPLLEAISEESYLRYLTNRDLYRQRPYEGADTREQVTAYARRINQVTGPGVFNDVLMAQQADVRQFRSVCRIATELYVPARHLAALHQQIRAQTFHYCPLAWRIRIGATSSWLHTR